MNVCHDAIFSLSPMTVPRPATVPQPLSPPPLLLLVMSIPGSCLPVSSGRNATQVALVNQQSKNGPAQHSQHTSGSRVSRSLILLPLRFKYVNLGQPCRNCRPFDILLSLNSNCTQNNTTNVCRLA